MKDITGQQERISKKAKTTSAQRAAPSRTTRNKDQGRTTQSYRRKKSARRRTK